MVRGRRGRGAIREAQEVGVEAPGDVGREERPAATVVEVSEAHQVSEGTQPLTDRQMEAYRCLWDFTLDHGFQPGFRTISDHIGGNTQNARQLLLAVQRKGWIVFPETKEARAIQFLVTPDGIPFRGLTPRV